MRATVTIDLDLPAEVAWRRAADQFGETGEWTSRLTSSYLDDAEMGTGATRVCRNGEEVLRERVIAFDPDGMSFTYTLLDAPRWVRSVRNTWTIEARGHDRSALTMEVDLAVTWWVRPMTPVMSIAFRRLLAAVQEEFKHWAETGEPHPRKRAHSERNARWRTAEALLARES